MSSEKPLVLLTGGSGYIGSWVLAHLLEEGYKVRAAVRPSKVESIKRTYANAIHQLEVAEVEDMTTSDYSEAFKGVSALIHTASPTSPTESDILEISLKGLENVLSHALGAGVKKIIFTSSVSALTAANLGILTKELVVTEDYLDSSHSRSIYSFKTIPPSLVYPATKLAAEKRFWEIASENPQADFTSILPSMVYGGWIKDYPVDPNNSTCRFVHHLISGEPGKGPNSFPKWPFPQLVNASDVAKAHVKALDVLPLENGQKKRFIISQGNFTYLEAIKLLRRERPELASRLPSEDDPAAKRQSPTVFDASFAAKILGMAISEYIPAEKTWLDTIDQLVAWEKMSNH